MQTAPPRNAKKTLNLASLYEISRVIGATLDLDKLHNVILTTMIKQTHADSGSLMRFDESRQELYIAASRGISERIARSARIKIGQGIAGIVAQQKQPLLIDNKTFFAISGKRPKRKIRSSLSIPLSFSDKLIGVINLNRVAIAEQFTDEDLKAISIFGTESAIALHNAQLYIAAEEKIQYLFRFNVVSSALNSAFLQEKIIGVLTECIKELLSADIYTLLLIEEEHNSLLIFSRRPLHPGTVTHLKKNLSMVISGLRQQLSSGRVTVSLKRINAGGRKKIYPRHLRSILNAPLIAKNKVLGMVSVYSVKDNIFTQRDQQNLTTLANQTAIALENANLYKSLRKTYLSTIKALAQAIEEKDPYTRGHSEMVSQYAVAITQALGFPPSFIEGIQIAGILHDIGKIGIPEQILTKPAQLTPEEYIIIKNHPLIGKRILEPVSFFWADAAPPAASGPCTKRRAGKLFPDSAKTAELEKTMEILKTTDLSAEIKAMIFHHHEHYGGGGYPEGMAGENIPIGSRILAVADAFEAMTADRPYRKAFPTEKALEILKNSVPRQFDPKIVDIFLSLIKNRDISLRRIKHRKEEEL